MSNKKQEALDEIFEMVSANLLKKLGSEKVNASLLNVARQFLKDNGMEVPKNAKNYRHLRQEFPQFPDDDE
jgi:hypothetical protein